MTKADTVADARAIFDALDCPPAAFSESQLSAINVTLARIEVALKSDHPFHDLALTKALVAKMKPGSAGAAESLARAKDAAYGLYMVVSMRADASSEAD